MRVSLPPELENFVAERVRSGEFESAAEVVTEGLRLLRAREADRSARLAELDAAIALAVEQVGRGELLDAAGSRDRVVAALGARGVDLSGP